MNKRGNSATVAIALLFACASVCAQTEYKSEIEPVPTSGYYNIALSHEIVAVSGLSFQCLRIRDTKGAEVPWFVHSEAPVRETDTFVEYPLAGNITRDSLNIITVANPDRRNLSRFCIVISAADVQKYASLRGSNDRRQWYVVKQRENITHSGYQHGNETYLNLDFPQGDYAWYEISLSNTQNSPLNILQVGRFENASLYSQLTEINLGRFLQEERSDNATCIHFPDLEYNYYLNKLAFEVEYKKGYFRQGYLGGHRHAGFELSSRGDNSFYIHTTTLPAGTPIVIINHDDPPLKIVSVKAYGLNRYLCAYLEAGERYRIEVNDACTSPPNYDIEHIREEIIRENPPTIRTIGLEKYVTPPREKRWLEKPLFLWSVIGLAGLFLALLCWKVVEEMRRR